MIRYAIYGAGGFGKEVKGMLDAHQQSFAGYIDDHKPDLAVVSIGSYDDVLFAMADPHNRENVVRKVGAKKFPYASLIDKNVPLHQSVAIGKGSIICPGVKFTVEIKVGEFVIINLNATIGHDVVIGDYCSIMPSANISGNVSIGKGVLVGSGATILQGLNIGEYSTIGAGAVVTRSVPSGVTVMGIPARIVR